MKIGIFWFYIFSNEIIVIAECVQGIEEFSLNSKSWDWIGKAKKFRMFIIRQHKANVEQKLHYIRHSNYGNNKYWALKSGTEAHRSKQFFFYLNNNHTNHLYTRIRSKYDAAGYGLNIEWYSCMVPSNLKLLLFAFHQSVAFYLLPLPHSQQPTANNHQPKQPANVLILDESSK